MCRPARPPYDLIISYHKSAWYRLGLPRVKLRPKHLRQCLQVAFDGVKSCKSSRDSAWAQPARVKSIPRHVRDEACLAQWPSLDKETAQSPDPTDGSPPAPHLLHQQHLTYQSRGYPHMPLASFLKPSYRTRKCYSHTSTHYYRPSTASAALQTSSNTLSTYHRFGSTNVVSPAHPTWASPTCPTCTSGFASPTARVGHLCLEGLKNLRGCMLAPHL